MPNINVYEDPAKHGQGDIWYPNAANYPACKFLLHADDVNNGDTVWKARIGNLVLTMPTGNSFVKDANGASGTVSIPVVTGTYPQLSMIANKKDFVCQQSGIFSTGGQGVELGDSNAGQGTKLTSSATGYLTFDASNYHNPDVPVGITYPYTSLMEHTEIVANDTVKHVSNGDNSEILQIGKNVVGSGGTVDQDWTGFKPVIKIPTSSSIARLQICAIWVFDIPPADVAIANAWMAANPGKLYPGWAGKL